MRKLVAKLFPMVGLVAVMVVAFGAAQAQTLSYRIKANIPFGFTVADKKFPAGEYVFSRAQPTAGDAIMLVSSVDGRTKTVRLTLPVISQQAKNKAAVVFHRYGDDYFLFRIWNGGMTQGREMPKSSKERKAQDDSRDNIVGIARPVETVTVIGEGR